MATSTVHPNHQLISSEDVEGTNVYDMNGNKIGDIDQGAPELRPGLAPQP